MLLGFGEALHGGEEILLLRNRLFQRLVEAHGYTAIAIESGFESGRLVNEYVLGCAAPGATSYEEVKERGFGHGFGLVEANRELVEWMRGYNADPAHRAKVRFYGFDIPSSPNGYASPRRVLMFAVDYLCAMDGTSGAAHRARIDAVIGADADWENPAMYADPGKAMGLTPAATALRIATEDLIAELRRRRPEFTAAGAAESATAVSGGERYLEALHHALIGRELLNSHAGFAAQVGHAALLGIRDAIMADTLMHIVDRERARGGRVLAFAHNGHLQRGRTEWPVLGAWWPAGAHVNEMLGRRYAVIGTGVGVSEANGIAPAEAGTLEARMLALPGPVRMVPTHRGEGIAAAGLAARSRSARNPSHGPLSAQSLTDFDWLAVLDSTGYSRGARALP